MIILFNIINSRDPEGYEQARCILGQNPDLINTRQANKTLLHHAVAIGNITIAELLLDKGADVNEKDEHGGTLLYYAVEGSDLGMVKILAPLSSGIKLYNRASRCSPLHAAVTKGNLEILSILISSKLDVNFQDKSGKAPLSIAVNAGNLEIVQTLIAAGANANLQGLYGKTVLYDAVEAGNLKILEILISAKNADIHVKDSNQATLFHVAAQKGNSEILRMLTSKSTSDLELYINSQDKDGKTPLYIAAEKGKREMVEDLIKLRANIDLPDKNGKTPLYIATEKSKREMVKDLIKLGANTELQDNKGKTPLYIAAEQGKVEILKLLIGSKAYVNHHSANGKTPLWLAVEKGDLKIAKILIDAKANIHVRDSNQATLLHVSAEKDHLEIIKALIAAGADVDVQDEWRKTPLYVAARHGNREVVELLLKKRADVYLQTSNGSTPLSIAAEKSYRQDHLDIAKMLIEYMLLQDLDAKKPTVLHNTESQRELSSYWDKCKEEIRAKGYIIGNIDGKNVSLYDFLTEKDDVELVSYLRNEDVVRNLNSSKEKFPILVDRIQGRIEEGKRKKTLYIKVDKLTLPSDDGKASLTLDAMQRVNQYLCKRQDLI